MSKRILVTGEYGIRNGGENSFLAVAPMLSKHGWEFHAAVPSNTEFASALAHIGIASHDLSFSDDHGERKSQSAIREDIARLIQKLDPAIVHCNSLSTSRLCGPVTDELKTSGLGYLRDILKLSRKAVSDINQLDRIIAVSHATKIWHVEQGMAKEKIHVVHNGVDTDQFRPALPKENQNVRQELNIPSKAHVLLFVGQIGMRKGVDILIDAFLQVADRLSGVHLLIVGERNSTKQEAIDYEIRLHDSVSTTQFSAQVHWLGRCSNVNEIMRESTLLIHPARQEPLGRVLLESAASGLPAITTNVGGSQEIFSSPDLQRLLFPKDDTNELVIRIQSLLDDEVLRSTLGTLCRETATQKFNLSRCANELNEQYLRLVDN